MRTRPGAPAELDQLRAAPDDWGHTNLAHAHEARQRSPFPVDRPRRQPCAPCPLLPWSADTWLDRYVWPSASERAGRTPDTPADAVEARERLDALAAAMDAAHWSGVAGATDRAVLAALVARGYARGSTTPTMSHRELPDAVIAAGRSTPRPG